MNDSIMNAPADAERRLLLQATVTAGAIAGVATAVPFLGSMAPSQRALSEGAPVDVDLSAIAPGTMVSIAWRGKPVWVLHRTDAMIASLQQLDDLLQDPRSKNSEQPVEAHNALRAIRPEYVVLVGICTHLGCVPLFRPDAAPADLGTAWPGGFYCPCHGSKFDLAGRVFKNVPAPVNLVVPPHQYLSESIVRIGI
ncbi:MAG TPA: ubiquinol-cytochrome c reductase iron-sulfur subunit [Oxalobacteraceae bacterium]|nr:ubiquinol-cytochrome c reductase iron-sulfur subunit [Oxalobacteraceae bacterium]